MVDPCQFSPMEFIGDTVKQTYKICKTVYSALSDDDVSEKVTNYYPRKKKRRYCNDDTIENYCYDGMVYNTDDVMRNRREAYNEAMQEAENKIATGKVILDSCLEKYCIEHNLVKSNAQIRDYIHAMIENGYNLSCMKYNKNYSKLTLIYWDKNDTTKVVHKFFNLNK